MDRWQINQIPRIGSAQFFYACLSEYLGYIRFKMMLCRKYLDWALTLSRQNSPPTPPTPCTIYFKSRMRRLIWDSTVCQLAFLGSPHKNGLMWENVHSRRLIIVFAVHLNKPLVIGCTCTQSAQRGPLIRRLVFQTSIFMLSINGLTISKTMVK